MPDVSSVGPAEHPDGGGGLRLGHFDGRIVPARLNGAGREQQRLDRCRGGERMPACCHVLRDRRLAFIGLETRTKSPDAAASDKERISD